MSARPDRVRGIVSAGVLAAGLVVPGTAAPQTATSLEDLATGFRTEHDVPGLVVATLGHAGERVLALGTASAETATPVDRRTRFEIGSVTKVFTALLLADLVVRGDVELDDRAAGHLAGEGRDNPALAAIRLHELATHTSGLPRLPANLRPSSITDPYVDYTAEDLETLMAGIEPPRAPGEAYEYSNLAAGLLGYLLARRAGGPLHQVLHERVIGPLGLDATFLPPPRMAPEDQGETGPRRIAVGHSNGVAVPPWRFDALGGLGGMWSTADDLIRFLRHMLHPPDGLAGDAIRLSLEPRADGPGGLTMALGWHGVELSGPGRVYFHNGGTGGFRAFVAFAPEAGIGAVVLTNGVVPLPALDAFALQVLLYAAAQPAAGAT